MVTKIKREKEIGKFYFKDKILQHSGLDVIIGVKIVNDELYKDELCLEFFIRAEDRIIHRDIIIPIKNGQIVHQYDSGSIVDKKMLKNIYDKINKQIGGK